VAEVALPSSAPRARVGLPRLVAAAAALAVAAVVAYWALFLRGFERTDDAFVEGHLVFLSPRVGGQVIEVRVSENQHVRAGEVLVRLDPADFETHVARARADLDAARNRMAQTHASADAAAARVRAAEVKLRHAELDLERTRTLFARGVASRTQLDAAQAARDEAAAELHAAQEQERAERAALGNQAPVRQAEAALREAELALEYAIVTAPFDGVVGKTNVELGANVSAGQPLVALADDSTAWVTANFKETQIAAMSPGARAEVRVDAFPGTVLRGHVESISPATGAKYALLPPDNATGNFTKVVQRVPVRIALDAVDGDAARLPARPAGASDSKPWLPVGLSVNVRVRVH
jgi:membrane fusion protein (multidrug efflux system)